MNINKLITILEIIGLIILGFMVGLCIFQQTEIYKGNGTSLNVTGVTNFNSTPPTKTDIIVIGINLIITIDFYIYWKYLHRDDWRL